MDRAPQVFFVHRAEPQHAVVEWDPDSFVLSAVLASNVTRFEPSTLADQINRHLGIGPDEPRIVIGDLDILLDSKGHMRTCEIRTNPKRWVQRQMRPLPPNTEPVWAEFSTTYDKNRVARHSVPVEIAEDGTNLSLLFGAEPPGRWGAIASNAVVGVTQDGHLCELRFMDTNLRLP